MISFPLYQHLLGDSFAHASEQKQRYALFTERHMQAMWLEQKYFKPLKTKNGEIIEVLSPGIWNSEAGPDFLKAHIRIGNRSIRGDVELHLAQESWYHHGHHNDPNYNNVVLHVGFWPALKENSICTSEGKAIECVYLQPSLTISESRILKLIDLDLYPYIHFSGSGSCANTLFHELPTEKAKTLFRSASLWRLDEKWERLKTAMNPSTHYLCGGIAMVLGYKHNANAFLEVFLALDKQKPKNEITAFAYALGRCGFFNAYFQNKWGCSSDYQQLFNEFQATYSNSEECLPLTLKLDKIRPANHPVRRLAVIAKLVCDPRLGSLEDDLIALWGSQWVNGQSPNWKKTKKALLELIPHYEDPYWNSHYTFEETNSSKGVALLGIDLKQEILVNVFLPFLYHHIEKKGAEQEKSAFADFYASLPAAKTRKSTYLNHRFFGGRDKALIKQADLQQGAYQIHRDFCIHFEASCHGCPFVERYNKAFLSQYG